MDTFEILLDAIDQYAEKSAEYKKDRAIDHAVYGQGYFSSVAALAMGRCKKQLREALDNHIRQVVAMKEIG